MTQMMRPVAIVGGLRIPFCRSNSSYADSSNLAMLSATLNGLVERYGLEKKQLGEVNAGAVISHSRDWNLAREAVLSTSLSPLTPAITLQQACGTSLQAAFIATAKIASGQIDSAIAAGSDTVSDVPIAFSKRFSSRLIGLSKARSFPAKLGQFKGFSFKELAPVPPSVNEPRTLMSMGEHCEMMAKTWSIGRQEQDEFALGSHRKASAAYEEGFFDDLIIPFSGVHRDNNLRSDSSIESLSQLRTVYDRSQSGTLTAGNSTPLTDGAAGVLLCSEEWAREHQLPVQAYLTHARTAAVDFVAGDGLLMAPTVAVSEVLRQAQLTLQDFGCYEIHEAFAAQVLCTLKAWQDESYCQQVLDRNHVLGEIDPERLNPKGSSLALGHPFAATGARVLATLAKQLSTSNASKGLATVCTAGGMGLAAILQS